uniref:Polyprotein n=1 Tax=Onchocerca flexuosa TaxID=387005 RepID=A0A183HVG8_9BILA
LNFHFILFDNIIIIGETDSVGRGARSFGGDSIDLLQPNSGSTTDSYAGEDPDLTAN